MARQIVELSDRRTLCYLCLRLCKFILWDTFGFFYSKCFVWCSNKSFAILRFGVTITALVNDGV